MSFFESFYKPVQKLFIGAVSKIRNSFLIRYMMAGLINTIFGWLVYSLFIVCGSEIWLALLFGMALGVVFNFFIIGGFVFRKLILSHFPGFVLVYFLIYVLNYASLKLLVSFTHSAIIGQSILTLPFAFLSFVFLKSFVFVEKT